MSSKQSTETCHKTRLMNCEGRLLERHSSYGKWAYWCKDNPQGWSPDPCVHMSKSKKKAKIYSVDGLMGLDENCLFGLYCLIELDSTEHPTIKSYANVFKKFKELGRGKVIQYLANQEINVDKESQR